MDAEPIFNQHNKEEFPPAHTAEHLLNQLMVRMFGCERSSKAHIERKMSKISYVIDQKPDRKEEKEIERQMNLLIAEDLQVSFEQMTRSELEKLFSEADGSYQGRYDGADDYEPVSYSAVSLERLPANASEMIRLVRIGDFDICPCIGRHVRSTAQIGRFELLGTNWDNATHEFRIRYKIVQ
ncbi:MAG: hypothetical protein IJ844_01660 [Prevotella sp.]|nr:hypothetical protein [Prevotella sp.]